MKRPVSQSSDEKRAFSGVVASLGAQGDGVIRTPDGPVYAPFVLPGETVEGEAAGDRASFWTRKSDAPDRVSPPCPHFAACGGCAVQHASDGFIASWKRDKVIAALASRGIETDVTATRAAWGEGRRRARFHAMTVANGAVLGFSERGSHRIVDVRACPVLAPALEAALPALKALAREAFAATARLELLATQTESGLDVDLNSFGRKGLSLTAGVRTALASRAAQAGFARLTCRGETLYQAASPLVAMGKARVSLPPGPFLQATAEAEDVLFALAREALGPALKPGARIVDLFAGLGPFTFRLAETARVSAYELDAAAIGALKDAARTASGLKPIEAFVRDLFREPVSAFELRAVDGVVLDPARAGAPQQSKALAGSTVARIAYVSCSPASFARDARVLIDGGYRLTRVTPVDQFRFSPHIELVGAFER